MISDGNGHARGVIQHKDSFGFLRTALGGVTAWTDRQIRTTGVVVPHIAKNDLFSYNIQLNHDKQLDANLDGFHLHAVPVSEPTNGDVFTVNYTWGWFNENDTIPDVLPNSGSYTSPYMSASYQYQNSRYSIITSMTHPTTESYSSFVLIKCQRANDGTDTYAGELALLGADVHYTSDRYGSKFEAWD